MVPFRKLFLRKNNLRREPRWPLLYLTAQPLSYTTPGDTIYSWESSGLSSTTFNDVWVPGAWSSLDLDAYAETISARLANGGMWFSGLDLEVRWLSSQAMPVGVFVPPAPALAEVAKPAEVFAGRLELAVPDHVLADTSDEELFDFGQRHSWRIWLKGAHYSALPIRSWVELCAGRIRMAELWGSERGLFIQRHIAGEHVSIAFAAHRGTLLGAVTMNKTTMTAEGKTWAGRVSSLDGAIYERLERAVADIQWTGGAEIECIEDGASRLWVMEVNPRFPAWIFGAALAGQNLPAALVHAHTGTTPKDCQNGAMDAEFVRVVVEVPRRLGPRNGTGLVNGAAAVHPSGMPDLTRVLNTGRFEVVNARSPTVITLPHVDLSPQGIRQTPARVMLDDAAKVRFHAAADAIGVLRNGGRSIISYSIKTNPDQRLVHLAARHGMAADAISQDEAAWANTCGVAPSRLILNGPGKLWPHWRLPTPVGLLFADSISELDELQRCDDRKLLAQAIGVRLRPATVRSRFGIAIDSLAEYDRLVSVLARFEPHEKLSLHFHIAAGSVGTGDWEALFAAFLTTAADLQKRLQRPIGILDVGGGWTPAQWDHLVDDRFDTITESAMRFDELEQLIFEPGKSLTQDVELIVSTVLRVVCDASGAPHELIIDGSVAEVPLVFSHPHRIGRLVRGSLNRVQLLERGEAQILGRLCMEFDILAERVLLPADITVGDRIIIFSAGAYDASMSYVFGRGGAASLEYPKRHAKSIVASAGVRDDHGS